MLNSVPVDNAELVLRDRVAKVSQNRSTIFLSTLEGFKQFVEISFEVPDSPDSDGLLIEYGVSDGFKASGFYLHLVRQFEQLEEDGDHGSYTQTYCDIIFTLDNELKALGHHARW